MPIRTLAVALLLAGGLALTATTPAGRAGTGRGWQVSPARDIEPGTTLEISGHGCLKRATATDDLTVAVNSSRGLLGYANVAADGSWSLTRPGLGPRPGQYDVQLNSVCLDNSNPSRSTVVFNYSPVLTVTYRVPINLTAFPIQAPAGQAVSGAIAFFAYPDGAKGPIPPSQFRATVYWGDGKVAGPAQVVSASKLVNQGLVQAEGYFVTARHSYTSALQHGKLTVIVKPPVQKASRATATVDIWPTHPSAYFIANPPAGTENGISLMMPGKPAPGQLAVVARKWVFLDNYNPVIDQPTSRPVYNATIAGLVADPGSVAWRAQAINLGILPQDADGLIGGLSDDNVRQVANVWRAYWPYHIVPHLYDEYGVAGVELNIIDASGSRSHFTRNVTIARDCLKWGGPLSGLFGGFTDCDTYNGIATQFGPHRSADWISIDVSKLFGNAGKTGFGGGVSLTVTRGVFQDPGSSIFLTVHLNAGLGLSLGGTFARGWVGPPDPSHAVSDDTINSFVSGLSVDAGFSAGFNEDGIGLGLGFDSIYSPSSGTAGEQIFSSTSGASASVGISCSWSLTNPPPTLDALLERFMRQFSSPSSPPGSSELSSAETAIGQALVGSGFNLINSLPNALAQC